MRPRRATIWYSAALAALVGLGWAGYRFANQPPASSQSELKAAALEVKKPEPPTTVTTDGTAVFMRAFWRRPGPADKIVHAERREWADADGVKKWQWFLVVEASPELVKYLRDENAFRLPATASTPSVEDAPPWFDFEERDIDVMGSPRGGLRLIFSKKKPLLFATDSGLGFRPGAPSPPKPTSGPLVQTGELPLTAPPNPPRGE